MLATPPGRFHIMSVLIFAHHNDEHALAVRRALMAEGRHCAIFCSDEFPVGTTVSVDPSVREWRLDGPLIGADVADFDVVWNRRNKPAALVAALHPDDRLVAQTESTLFLREMRLTVAAEHQVWINKEHRQRALAAKPAQLALAHSVGLTIPRTLVSNDPARIRQFVRDTAPTIVKALDKIGWEDEEGQVVLPTTMVTLADCEDDVALSACPMIYQQRVDKAYELRVVMFGDDLLAVRLDSQSAPDGQVDWRAAAPNSFAIAETTLPDDLVARLRTFCRRADVLHGSFDLAITPEGEAVFFEFNVQGQSLWIENWNADIRVLDRLVQFLLNPVREFRFSAAARHDFASYLASEQQRATVRA